MDITREELRKLPFLRPYFHQGGHYQPLQGIEHVANLLQTCRQKHPSEYKKWQVVSLKSYSGINNSPGEVIEIQAALPIGKSQTLSITRLIFSVTTDFNIQLDRLGHIREVSLSIKDPLKRVDLSLRDAAAVQFDSGRTSLLLSICILSMSHSRVVAAVEMGTTKVVVLVGEIVDDSEPSIIDHSVGSSDGIKKGVIVDLQKA